MKQNFISFALFSTILLGSSFSSFAEEVKAEDTESTKIELGTNGASESLPGSELLNRILKVQNDKNVVSKAESDFLDSNYKFSYVGLSNPDNYNVSYLDGYYWVEAFEDGNYIPKYLSVIENEDENHYLFNKFNKQLIARSPTLEGAKIVYEYKADIYYEKVNKLLSAAYLAGEEEHKKIVELTDYNDKKQKYENYINLELPAYENYLLEKAAYALRKENYDQFLIDNEKYPEELKAYQDYKKYMDEVYYPQLSAYTTYLEQLDIYNKNKSAYDSAVIEYNNKMSTIDRQLSTLDLLFKKMGSLGRSILDNINSDSVDVVVEGRDKIAVVVDGVAVDLAGEKTKILKPLLNEYHDLLEGSKQERYIWYQKHYISLRNAITTLTQCLEYFYGFGVVSSEIENKGKTQKYIEFVAELIYFSEAINDEPVLSYIGNYELNSSCNIGDKAGTYPSLLKTELINTNEKAYPLRGSYPAIPGEAVIVKPTEVEKPVLIPEVKEPVLPVEPEQPGDEPEEVSKPKVVADPGSSPEIQLNPELQELAEAYENGELFNRKPTANNVVITINKETLIDTLTLKEMVVLCDTTNGVSAGSAKVREFIFYKENPSSELIKTPVTSHFGVFATNPIDIDLIFGIYGTPNEMPDGLFDVTSSQESAVTSFSITWKHVLNNPSGKDFVDLGYKKTNDGYELFEPTYNYDGSLPTHPDVFVDNVRRFSYVFVGYDFTDEVDSTNNKLSGLTITDEIVASQHEVNKANINVVFEKVECFNVTIEGHLPVSYLDGSKIFEPDDKPTKTSTDGVRYMHVGWKTKNGSEPISFPYEIHEDTELTPVFREIGVYMINFESDGKIISSQKVEEGSMPIIPEEVTKPRTSSSFFVFDKWNSAVVPVTGNATYVAEFNEFPIVEDADIRIEKLNVVITSESNSIDFKNFLNLAKEDSFDNKGVILNIENNQISLNKSQILYLASVNASTITLEKNDEENDDISYLITIKDAAEQNINNSSLLVPVILNTVDASHAKVVDSDGNVLSSSLVNNSSVKVVMRCGAKVMLKHYYKVSFDKYMSAVDFVIDGETAVAGKDYEFTKGTQVEVKATPKDSKAVKIETKGGTTTGLFYNDKDGYRVNLDTNMLTIGTDDIVICADVNRIMHTINLKVDGVVYETIKATYGSLVNLPIDITKLPDSEYRYVFVGWNQDVSILDKDYEIEAMFEQIPIKDAKEDDGVSSDGLTFGQKISIAALSVVAVAIGGTVIGVSIKNHKKPQKN